MNNLHKALKGYGYADHIKYEKDGLRIFEKNVLLSPESLFFIDIAYRIMHTYVFALSAPKYDIKGVLVLELPEYHALGMSGFSEKFNIEVQTSWDDKIIIQRQYGMRKIYENMFDAKRYILREGFPDFPTCPYGHRFKILGYDIEQKEYVRFTPSILKNQDLKKITHKEKYEKDRV
ncbi:hypothetical protein MNB_SV-3-629 [hydrothermal vent metagenome]|uniref:Uncharacterized protein n=1 Tax=hydrothermal vent metagenome TaxID=652676 RepID=A0A1W1CWC3_9ZZZZ